MMITILILICLLIVIAASILFFILGLRETLKNLEKNLKAEVKEVKFRILKQLATNKKISDAPVPSIETRDDEDLYDEEYERAKREAEN